MLHISVVLHYPVGCCIPGGSDIVKKAYVMAQDTDRNKSNIGNIGIYNKDQSIAG